MAKARDIRMKNPAHPGGFVKTEIIEPLGLSVTAAAQVLWHNEGGSLNLSERARVPFARHGDTDRESVRRFSMETLMRMQNSFDIAQAHRRRRGEIKVKRYVPKAALPEPHSKPFEGSGQRTRDSRTHLSGEPVFHRLPSGIDRARCRLAAADRRRNRRPGR